MLFVCSLCCRREAEDGKLSCKGGMQKPLLLVPGLTAKARKGERDAGATTSHRFVPAAGGEVQRWAQPGMAGTEHSAGCRMSPALRVNFSSVQTCLTPRLLPQKSLIVFRKPVQNNFPSTFPTSSKCSARQRYCKIASHSLISPRYRE